MILLDIVAYAGSVVPAGCLWACGASFAGCRCGYHHGFGLCSQGFGGGNCVDLPLFRSELQTNTRDAKGATGMPDGDAELDSALAKRITWGVRGAPTSLGAPSPNRHTPPSLGRFRNPTDEGQGERLHLSMITSAYLLLC